MSGFVSMSSSNLGFLPKVNSYGLQFPKFGLLKVLYANVANDTYFVHIWPKPVRCLVRICVRDLIPCSAWSD